MVVPSRRAARKRPIAIAIAVAVAVAAALIAASIVGSKSPSPASDAPVVGAVEARALTTGLRQRGLALGSSNAPLTIEEFADLQCPYCQRFALEVLPLVIQRYVRTGAVRLLFRPLAFIGGDSLTAARAVVAAGRQDTAWQLIDLLYRNQGAENSGWVTNDLLDGAARALGMDAGKAATFANGDAAGSVLGRASAEASRLGVSSTPTLVLLRAGHRPQLIANALDLQALFATLDAARN